MGGIPYSCKKKLPSPGIPVQLQQQLDSLDTYYKLAKNNAHTKGERMAAISTFITGAKNIALDSLHCKGLALYAKLLNKYSGPETAISVSYTLLETAEQSNDSSYIGLALYRLGYYNKKQGKYLKAFNFYNQSFKVYRNIKDSIYAGRSLMTMSNIQRVLGDHNACMMTATDGLTYLEGTQEYRLLGGLYQNIAIAFMDLGNSKEALFWNTRNMGLFKDSIARKQFRSRDIFKTKNSRASILREQGRYTESIAILNNLIADQGVIQQPREYAKFLANLGYVKFLKDPENPESEEMLLKAYQIWKEQEDLFGLYGGNLCLTKYYKNKDVVKARAHAYEAFKAIQKIGDREGMLEILTLITALTPDSLEDHQRFKEVSLELMELRKKTREIYAPTRFENESLLKENEAKNRKIAQVRNQNTIYLLVLLVALMGIGFSIFFFRQRTRNLAQQSKIAQFEARYETEIRISKRLHDELGNDIFQLMLQYQKNPHDPQIKEKLNTSYQRARDISRENNEFDTGSAYGQELNNMLQNYAQNGQQLLVRGLDAMEWDTQAKTTKITVYRVLQELMTNMQKHSQASLVALLFKEEDKKLIIRYSDNGLGMDLSTTISKNGLQNTEKRIQAIGGSLIFDSEKDKGVKAEIQIPN
ncbi:sensor histidine kinase [Aquimarina hainanensis]|uniref:histidine kinase n=1 Tax=Aquimarina hainanensis TaxID=1578017 RepID=A0ABW5NCK0_9FLAO